MGLGEKLTKGSIGGGVNIAKHGNMAGHGVEALQSARYDEVEQTEDKMPADVTKNIETNKTKEDPSIDSPAKMSGSYSGKFMEQPLRYGMTNKSPVTKKDLYSPKKMLSEKQSEVIDGADGSKKNDKIEGSEMAALSKK
tara:strand:+ start:123 stop:539 length:417 start_codon:yes stop_codon:yes gene_type:complete